MQLMQVAQSGGNVAMQVAQPFGQLWNQAMQVAPPNVERMQVVSLGGPIFN